MVNGRDSTSWRVALSRLPRSRRHGEREHRARSDRHQHSDELLAPGRGQVLAGRDGLGRNPPSRRSVPTLGCNRGLRGRKRERHDQGAPGIRHQDRIGHRRRQRRGDGSRGHQRLTHGRGNLDLRPERLPDAIAGPCHGLRHRPTWRGGHAAPDIQLDSALQHEHDQRQPDDRNQQPRAGELRLAQHPGRQPRVARGHLLHRSDHARAQRKDHR
jgi:hypothetical protein